MSKFLSVQPLDTAEAHQSGSARSGRAPTLVPFLRGEGDKRPDVPFRFPKGEEVKGCQRCVGVKFAEDLPMRVRHLTRDRPGPRSSGATLMGRYFSCRATAARRLVAADHFAHARSAACALAEARRQRAA